MSARFTPAEWLCAALGTKGPAEAFKVISIHTAGAGAGESALVRVLHKDSGAAWQFACAIEREGVL